MSESATLRVNIDTNVFVSGAISPRGRPRNLLRAWHEARFELLLSDRQRAELDGVFDRPKIVRRYRLTPEELGSLYADPDGATRVVPSASISVPLRDPNDEHILAAAVGGNADYLVTGDYDLLVYRGDPRLRALKIVTVAEFLDVLDEEVQGQQ